MDYAVGLLLVSTAGSVADTEGEPRGSGAAPPAGVQGAERRATAGAPGGEAPQKPEYMHSVQW